MSSLPKKQEMFCREYIIDLNSTQACIRAGYSKKTAAEQGSRMLSKVNVQERIHELMQERCKEIKYTANDVLLKLKEVVDVSPFVFIGKTVEELNEMPPTLSCLVKSYSLSAIEGELVMTRVVLMDKDKAIEMIARHIGFFEVDNKQKGISSVTLVDGVNLPD